jgi:hypothetical protein
MPQMATAAAALKELPDAAPAQARTHARPRTAGRHSVAQPSTRPLAHRPHMHAWLRAGLDQLMPPTRCGWHHQLMLPTRGGRRRTHAAAPAPAAHARRASAPRVQARPGHARPRMHARQAPETGFPAHGSRVRGTPATRARPVHMALDREA